MEKNRDNFDISRFMLWQVQIGEFYKRKLSKAASECDMTKPEADVLLFLVNNPQKNTARDVVEYRGFSKGYVSKAVELLLVKQYIAISTSKEDRRYQHIEVCKEAAVVVATLRKAQLEFIHTITDGLEETDVQCFKKVLEKISTNLPQENSPEL